MPPRRRALVPLAPGVEEIEAVTLLDVLRRADVETVAAGLDEAPVRASRGVVLVPDRTLADAVGEPFDLVALPGGAEGTTRLCAHRPLLDLVRRRVDRGDLLAALCAAPKVLVAAGVASGRRVTAHPTVHAELERAGALVDRDRSVVVDGALVTSMGPGTALPFALRLVALLAGERLAEELARAMIAEPLAGF